MRDVHSTSSKECMKMVEPKVNVHNCCEHESEPLEVKSHFALGDKVQGYAVIASPQTFNVSSALQQ